MLAGFLPEGVGLVKEGVVIKQKFGLIVVFNSNFNII